MKHNVNKIIADTKNNINIKYDLSVDDIRQIKELSIGKDEQERIINTILNAFAFGYAMGGKAERKTSKASSRNKY